MTKIPHKLIHGALTGSVIESFYDVHGELGFGFREYIYARALERALIAKGHRVDREYRAMVYFRGKPLALEKIDMVVDLKLIVENKAREKLPPDTIVQLFGYLSATDFEVGLVCHYGRTAQFYRTVCENRY